jgi:exosortase
MDLIRMASGLRLRFSNDMDRVLHKMSRVKGAPFGVAEQPVAGAGAALGQAPSRSLNKGAQPINAEPDISDPLRKSAPWYQEHWFLLFAAVAAAEPGIVALARNYWSTEQGAAGPIILLTGLWLLHHEAKAFRTVHERFAMWLVPIGLLIVGACTVAASVTAKQWLQLLGIYVSLALVLYGVIGRRQWLNLRAPILYLAFVIPPPDNITVSLTHALKDLVANASVGVLSQLGYPAARDGVLLYMGQYELVVAAACSGMNSIVSLAAIGLFYVYLLHRAHMRYAALLAVLMIPVALFANAVRVVGLLLITYYAGDAAGQGILHEAAGLFIFVVALTTLIGIDRLLAPLLLRRERRA